MQEVAQHIVKLLGDHNCVIVPGFGGFVTNYQSAKIHPTSFIFNSPSKSVAFNVNLTTNDGLLTDTIAREEKVSHARAESMISTFVGQIKTALLDHKPVKLAGIGRLIMDIENNIQFLPDNSQNLLAQSFGLYSFTAQPIQRELVPELKPVKAISKPVTKKKRSAFDRMLPYAAIFLLALGTLQIFIGTSRFNFDYAEIFGLNKIFAKQNYQLNKYNPAKFDVNPSITYYRITDADTTSEESNIVNINVVPEPVPQITGSSTSFVLIAGSLYTEDAVQILLNKLSPEGYTGFVKPWGKYKLAAIPIPDNVSAIQFRADFIAKTGIKDAWITKTK